MKKPTMTRWQLPATGVSMVTLLAVGLGGCGSSETAATDAVTLSGSVATSGARYAASFLHDSDAIARISPVASSAVSDIASIYCVTFSVPPTAGEGTVSAGSFSVAISGAQGKKLGCLFLDGAEDVLATMVFQSSSSEADSKSFSGEVGLGAIAVNLTTGEAVVDVASITGTVDTSTVSSASAAFDMTGSWAFATIPTAEKSAAEIGSKASDPCAVGTSGGGGCSGPEVDMTIYLKRAAGVKADASPGFGMMMWKSAADFASCGSTLGDSYADILTNTGIDFTSSGINQGAFTYLSSVTTGGHTYTLTDGWKITSIDAGAGALSTWGIANCVQTASGYTCTDGDGTTRVEKGGGCVVTSTGVPVQVTSWGGITGCSTSAADSDGFKTQTCTGTSNSVAVTCTNTYKVSTGTDSDFDWSTSQLIAQNSACSTNASGTNAQQLASLRCYADAYHRAIGDSAAGCLKRIQTDWAAELAADFVQFSDAPNSMMFRGLLEYDSSGTVATMYNNEYENRGAQAGSNSWVPCRVKNVNSLVMMKISDTKIKGYYKGISTYAPSNPSDSKPACVAEFGSGQVEKFIFYLNKQ